MNLEELLNELLDIANEHGGNVQTNIENVVSTTNKQDTNNSISITIKTKP